MAQNVIDLDEFDKENLREFHITSLGINLTINPLSNIVFPTLPYNFQMLMSDLEWPEKAMKNPNGTLFMHPGEIDDSPADDLGLQCFGKFDEIQLTGSFNKENTKNVNMTKSQADAEADTHRVFPKPVADSYNPYFLNSVYQYLTEASYNMVGFDIDVPDTKARNDKYATISTNVVDAISTYITKSLEKIAPVVQLVAGQGASASIKKINDVVLSANSMGKDNIKVWIESYDNLEQKTKSDKDTANLKALESEIAIKNNGYWVLSCLGATNFTPRPPKTKAEVLNDFKQRVDKIRSQRHLDQLISDYIENCPSFNTFENVMKIETGEKDPKGYTAPIPKAIKENINTKNFDKLFEATSDDNLGIPASVDYDALYRQIYSILVDAMSEVITPRAEWVCMKSLEENMKNLKDRADAEITKKIEIICKTNGQKSLVHWPFRAEGLLTMWNRYSAELQNRINNRIGQLTGTGGRETGSAEMVEDFLRNTYPRIIAAMLIYKIIFLQLAVEYKKGIVVNYTADNVPVIAKAMGEMKTQEFVALLAMFDATQNP